MAAALFVIAVCAGAQEFDNAALARKIVTVTARVQPGESVLISGEEHMIPLMEELALQVYQSGGVVEMLVTTDRINRAYNTLVADELLDRLPALEFTMTHAFDFLFVLPIEKNPAAVWKDITPEHRAKIYQPWTTFWEKMDSVRTATIIIPSMSPELALQYNFSYAEYQRRYWEAVNADYQTISRQAQRLKGMLVKGAKLRLTSPSGTDMTCVMADRNIHIDDGILSDEERRSGKASARTTSLPGGFIFLVPMESSAAGRVAAGTARCGQEIVRSPEFIFSGGRMKELQAAGGIECITAELARTTGPNDRFAALIIGLNPGFVTQNDYYPARGAGIVSIMVGGNKDAGGDNDTASSFTFFLDQVTLSVDGVVVIENGVIKL